MDHPVSKGQKLEAEVIRWADAGKGVAQIGGCACSRLRPTASRRPARFTTAAAAAACST